MLAVLDLGEDIFYIVTKKGENAISSHIEFEVMESSAHKPIIRDVENSKLTCPICKGGEITQMAICAECGQIYHKSCIDLVRVNSPQLRCSFRFCPGRKKGIPLLQAVKLL
jgi:late competence protein required for DNA uptake (superfamily II DNA/RNA helicase)